MSFSRGLRSYERRTVIVHGPAQSTRGVLVHAYKDCLVLRHARALDQDADLAGEVVIPKTPGVWMQIVEAEVAQ